MTAAAVNQRVRVAEGARGEIVILGAWCSSCDREVMPGEGTGACPWCQRVVVDEDSLSARSLVKQMQSGNGAAPPTDVRGSQPPSKWTRETVIASIQSFAAEHGRTPTQKDAAALVTAAKSVFASWGDAVVAAGFERPRRGVTNRVDAGVAQPDRAPAVQRSRFPRPAKGNITEDAQITLTSRAAADDETGGALDLATLTDGDAHEWIARCDQEAERCTEEAARLVRRAKGFETIGDGLRILRETSA